MTKVLGISAFYHDSAAALIDDDHIVFAAQEERYTRKKHDDNFPRHAIRQAFAFAQCSVLDLDAVVFYDKPLLKFERLLETYLANAPKGFISFARAMPIWLKQKLYLKTLIRQELRLLIAENLQKSSEISLSEAKKQAKSVSLPKLLFTSHHQSHAAAAFYPSPFSEAAIVCLDGVGEWTSASIWHGQGSNITELLNISFPHSLGLLYSAFTYYCGFRVNSGEYKLMGLAPYGEAKYQSLIEENIITIKDDGSFFLNMEYFSYAVGSRMINRKFEQLFGAPALAFDQVPTQFYMDIAASIQALTEKIVIRIARHAQSLTNSQNLCLAGGVALNCVANGKLAQAAIFDHIWIQPAAGDAGSSLGAALEALYGYFNFERNCRDEDLQAVADSMQGAYLGDGYDDAHIVSAINAKGLPFEKLDQLQLDDKVSQLLNEEKVVGWFQGRMEFGPRALGNRSILGDPRSAKMQSKMNLAIKQRESFRPFAPAVLAEDASHWFSIKGQSPYMLLVAQVLQAHRLDGGELKGLESVKQVRSSIPAITHVDYTARVQTVSQETNPRFYSLLKAFKKLSGIGMLINTSFNVRGEPPVCSPQDAIRCFLATDMDYLVVGDYILDKHMMPKAAINEAKSISFEKD